MKHDHHIFPLRILFVAAFFIMLLSGCKEETSTSVYDPNASVGQTPVISTISPSDSGIAGVTDFTITGSGFSSDPDLIRIFFDSQMGTLLQTSPTQLVVRSPQMAKDSVAIKISVRGALSFSNTRYMKLKPAYVPFDSIVTGEAPWAVAIDAQGNIYVSIVSYGAGIGVKKFTPDGIRTDYAPKRFETKYTSLRFSPAGMLYGAWGLQALVEIPGGNANPVIWVQFPGGTRINDFDFDAQGNLWAGGSHNTPQNAKLYRVKPNKDTLSYPMNALIRSVRVNNGYLYIAGKMNADSSEKIVRYPILGDSLGAQEVYFNFSASSLNSGSNSLYSMAFAADGDLFVGTDRAESLLLIHPNGTVEEFYPGIFSPTLHILVWGKGTELFAVKGTASSGSVGSSSQLLGINTQKAGFP
jgi:hypothetical protein